jgi:hypothetical protein
MGVVDLFAALEVATGRVTHTLSDSHTGDDFLAFMKKVERQHSNRELHVILDNSSTHGTPDVQSWLAAHPLIRFHYTPTSASWLNQVDSAAAPATDVLVVESCHPLTGSVDRGLTFSDVGAEAGARSDFATGPEQPGARRDPPAGGTPRATNHR